MTPASDATTTARRRLPLAGVAFGLLLVLILAVGAWWHRSVASFKVPSDAMRPGWTAGQQVVLHKLGHGHAPRRGDVVAFTVPGPFKGPPPSGVGRVIGVEGDTVEVQARRVLVNGTILERTSCEPPQYVTVVQPPGASYPTRVFSQCEREQLPGASAYRILFDEATHRIRASLPPQKVLPGTVYLLGDNRDHADDSRRFGLLPLDRLQGTLN